MLRSSYNGEQSSRFAVLLFLQTIRKEKVRSFHRAESCDRDGAGWYARRNELITIRLVKIDQRMTVAGWR